MEYYILKGYVLINRHKFDIEFQIFLSKGYIYRYCTGPTILKSYGRCTGRCSIESKNLGGNICSNLHKIYGISLSNRTISSTSRVVEVRSLKNNLNSVSACHTLLGSTS